jgi:ribosomal protein S19
MGRSLKKPPFVDPKLLAKVAKLKMLIKQTTKNQPKTLCRGAKCAEYLDTKDTTNSFAISKDTANT